MWTNYHTARERTLTGGASQELSAVAGRLRCDTGRVCSEREGVVHFRVAADIYALRYFLQKGD